MSDDLFFLPAVRLAQMVRDRQVTAVELAESFLRRIDEKNAEINAFVTVTYDLALEAARRCDAATARGLSLGPLHGVPVAIKDLFDLRKGVRSTWGSAPLKDFVATETALYVQRIEDAGGVIVGKTNAPEFGHRGITDNFVTGATSTPFAIGRNSGGSSGGAAAAVAAGLVPLAQGTDGGGSIRIPAAWCGVVGIKPSFGRVGDVPRPNALLSASPFGLVGPLARSVDDASLMLKAIGRPHSRDPFSIPTSPDVWDADDIDLTGLRVAYLPTLGGFPVAADVAAVVDRAARAIASAGAIVETPVFTLPDDQYELGRMWCRLMGMLYIDSLEAMKAWGIDLMEHLDELTPAFADMLRGTASYSALGERHDQHMRTRVLDAVLDVLDVYDLIITPTLAISPVPNLPGGATLGPSAVNGVPVDTSIGWCLTYPFNFTGHPAVSVPAGLTDEGFPVGLQLVTHRWDDKRLLSVAKALESVTPWADSYPGLRAR